MPIHSCIVKDLVGENFHTKKNLLSMLPMPTNWDLEALISREKSALL